MHRIVIIKKSNELKSALPNCVNATHSSINMYSELGKTNEEYICVIGDSFAGNRRDCIPGMPSFDWSWVNLIESNNAGKTIGLSFPGQSFWHQRRWFMDHMSDWKHVENTVLVFVHTQYARLPHLNDVAVTPQVFKADRNNPAQNELYFKDPSGALFDLAKTFYSSALFEHEFYRFAFLSWLKEINELTVNFKKVIHLFGFDNDIGRMPFKHQRFYFEKMAMPNSVPVTTSLLSIAAAERGTLENWGGSDHGNNIQNHLSKHNNIELAKFVQWAINDAIAGQLAEIPTASFNLKDPAIICNIAAHKEDFIVGQEIPGNKIRNKR